MKLETYLQTNRLTHEAFARRIGATQGAVTRYINNRRFPRPAVLKAISEATEGQVTANDFLTEESAQ